MTFFIANLWSEPCPNSSTSKYKDGGTVPIIFRNVGSTMNVRMFNHLKYPLIQC